MHPIRTAFASSLKGIWLTALLRGCKLEALTNTSLGTTALFYDVKICIVF